MSFGNWKTGYINYLVINLLVFKLGGEEKENKIRFLFNDEE